MSKFILICLGFCLTLSLHAQLSEGIAIPLSQRSSVSLLPMITVDFSQHHSPFYQEKNKKNELKEIGYIIPFQNVLNQDKSRASKLEDGYLWRYEFIAANALALNVYFSKYKLPKGAMLYAINADYSTILGGFGEHNNNELNNFAFSLLAGDKIYLEYFEPYDAAFEAELEMEGLGYVFRDFEEGSKAVVKDFGDAESCQVNVRCTEGTGKDNQIRSVVRILVKNGNWLGWCSGTVMNNTANNCKPYLLTADHCALNNNNYATGADKNQWVFYFNYESSNCSSPSTDNNIPYSTLIGGITRAQSLDGGGIQGSDFLLLELNSYIPNDYNVYYAGWSLDIIENYPYIIHHPSGDLKKISSGRGTTTEDTWGGRILNTHLAMSWASTVNGHGTTEGGSSGGPLFNSNGLVIGTLTGGYTSCDELYAFDYFGSMKYHFNPQGNLTSTNHLKPWLANGNNNASWAGRNSNLCTHGISVNEVANEITLNIYPNPSKGIFHIALEENLAVNIKVIDILGRIVWQENQENANNLLAIDLSNQSNGVYFIQISHEKGIGSKKIVLQK